MGSARAPSKKHEHLSTYVHLLHFSGPSDGGTDSYYDLAGEIRTTQIGSYTLIPTVIHTDGPGWRTPPHHRNERR